MTVWVPHSSLGYTPPPQTPTTHSSEPKLKFKTPMSKAQLLKLREEMAADPALTQLMYDFNTKINSAAQPARWPTQLWPT
jgi:hypothetical protein